MRILPISRMPRLCSRVATTELSVKTAKMFLVLLYILCIRTHATSACCECEQAQLAVGVVQFELCCMLGI